MVDPSPCRRLALFTMLALLALASLPAHAVEDETPPRADYVSYTAGAWLVSVESSGAERGPSRYLAFQTYDGHTTPRGLVSGASPDCTVTLIYALPAPTTFDRFAVPEVTEVPSPSATFFRDVEVWGSADSASDGFERLAQATLTTHSRRGLETELEMTARLPVRYLKLVLRGGIQDLAESMGYQFSELIGNGVQQPVELDDGFTGLWDTQLPDVARSAGILELKQDGVSVTGCYEGVTIEGSVSGNILRASGLSRDGRIPSLYVMLRDADGAIRGASSVNGGPFNMLGGPVAPEGTTSECSDIPEPALGCGSTVYVQFEFDSADLRPESAPVLADLYEGLAGVEGSVVIEGHTSSEGSEEYNRGLSERRAQAVVDDLIRRGLAAERIEALGKGELQPIASNKDEAGRSLNRRVEVDCPAD